MTQQGIPPVYNIVLTTRAVLPDIRKKYGVKRIGIFGSCARNEQTDKSDVDILVEFNQGKATFDNFMQLASFLEDIFTRHVDLLTSDGMSKHLRPFIEKEVIWIEE
jgi:predicted nucleotidyltransferase